MRVARPLLDFSERGLGTRLVSTGLLTRLFTASVRLLLCTGLGKGVTQDKLSFEKNGVKVQVNIFVLTKRKSIVNARVRHTHCACIFLESMSVLKMAERCVAEPLPCFEDAEQLIADDYFNHASYSVHEDDSCGSEDKHSSSGETSPTGATRKSFMDPREVDQCGSIC